MLGTGAIPAIIQLIAFVFMPESPRWLIEKGRVDEARKVFLNILKVCTQKQVLQRIYTSTEWQEFEINEISQQHRTIVKERQQVTDEMGKQSWRKLLI